KGGRKKATITSHSNAFLRTSRQQSTSSTVNGKDRVFWAGSAKLWNRLSGRSGGIGESAWRFLPAFPREKWGWERSASYTKKAKLRTTKSPKGETWGLRNWRALSDPRLGKQEPTCPFSQHP